MNELPPHPEGEEVKALVPVLEPIAVETFGGRVHVEWNPQAAVTPLGQWPIRTVGVALPMVLDEPQCAAPGGCAGGSGVVGVVRASALCPYQ